MIFKRSLIRVLLSASTVGVPVLVRKRRLALVSQSMKLEGVLVYGGILALASPTMKQERRQIVSTVANWGKIGDSFFVGSVEFGFC